MWIIRLVDWSLGKLGAWPGAERQYPLRMPCFHDVDGVAFQRKNLKAEGRPAYPSEKETRLKLIAERLYAAWCVLLGRYDALSWGE